MRPLALYTGAAPDEHAIAARSTIPWRKRDAAVEPLHPAGPWYKGALHVHTTGSDGKLTPEESVAFHREHGYHFLAITDHNAITDLSGQSEPGFLNIPGIEVTASRNALGQSYHLVVIGVRTHKVIPPGSSAQEAIDLWAESQGLIFLAHPYWSGMVVGEMMALERLHGLEVYNTSSDTDLGKGLASVHWDDVLARGKRWWGYAVDDTHGINDDAAGGWVWVKSEALDEPSIVRALKAGEFYSSCGPEIYDFRLENGVARVRCSDAAVINFLGHTQWGYQRRAAPGGSIAEAEYRLNGREFYLRAEVIDHTGRRAWTNPIYVR